MTSNLTDSDLSLEEIMRMYLNQKHHQQQSRRGEEADPDFVPNNDDDDDEDVDFDDVVDDDEEVDDSFRTSEPTKKRRDRSPHQQLNKRQSSHRSGIKPFGSTHSHSSSPSTRSDEFKRKRTAGREDEDESAPTNESPSTMGHMITQMRRDKAGKKHSRTNNDDLTYNQRRYSHGAGSTKALTKDERTQIKGLNFANPEFPAEIHSQISATGGLNSHMMDIRNLIPGIRELEQDRQKRVQFYLDAAQYLPFEVKQQYGLRTLLGGSSRSTEAHIEEIDDGHAHKSSSIGHRAPLQLTHSTNKR